MLTDLQIHAHAQKCVRGHVCMKYFTQIFETMLQTHMHSPSEEVKEIQRSPQIKLPKLSFEKEEA
jgi:hypothetical protein